MRRCKRTIVWIGMLVLLLAVCSACQEEAPGSQMDLDTADVTGETAAPAEELTSPLPEGTASAVPTGESEPANGEAGGMQQVQQSGAVAEVKAVVAYAFQGTLYAACEYQNVGDTPLVLTNAAFHMEYAGPSAVLVAGSVSESFTPIAAEHDVIEPGGIGYCTLWLPVDGLTENAVVTATAQLTAAPATMERVPLFVSEERLIQNYPGFATLSGKLKNGGSSLCELNVIYAGFYDANGSFLGAWHFTRAVTLNAGDSKAFVSHLKALPIPELAEHAATIRFSAFGL